MNKRIGIWTLIVLCIVFIAGCNQSTINDAKPNGNQATDSQDEKDVDNEETKFTEDLAIKRMAAYKQHFESLINDTNNQGKLTNYDSKEGVLNYFQEVMTESWANHLIDVYFNQKDDGLYLLAMDAPIWLHEQEDFSVKQINEREAVVIQELNNELIGHVNVSFHFRYSNDRWLVEKVETKQVEEHVGIKTKADSILKAIADKNMETLATYVHENKGLLLSPYVFIDDGAKTFTQKEIPNLLQNSNVYDWGTYDGSGEPIKLTPKQYFNQFVYDHPYENTNEIVIDELIQRGNMKNNILDTFPNAKTVEYHFKGTEKNNYMDWSSLILVFQLDETSKWKLVAIVHNQWTI